MDNDSPKTGSITYSTGGTTFEGSATLLYRLVALKSALKLEGHGIKIRRGFSALKVAQQETGLKTRDRAKLAAALDVTIDAMKQQLDIIDKRGH